jgi:hypothetical protein
MGEGLSVSATGPCAVPIPSIRIMPDHSLKQLLMHRRFILFCMTFMIIVTSPGGSLLPSLRQFSTLPVNNRRRPRAPHSLAPAFCGLFAAVRIVLVCKWLYSTLRDEPFKYRVDMINFSTRTWLTHTLVHSIACCYFLFCWNVTLKRQRENQERVLVGPQDVGNPEVIMMPFPEAERLPRYTPAQYACLAAAAVGVWNCTAIMMWQTNWIGPAPWMLLVSTITVLRLTDETAPAELARPMLASAILAATDIWAIHLTDFIAGAPLHEGALRALSRAMNGTPRM